MVALAVAVGVVRKDADRMMAVVAAEQAARSRAKAGKVGLARGRGRGDERGLVSSQTGGSAADASRLIELGETLRDAERVERGEPAVETITERPMPVFPEVARAVNAGELSVEASTMITRMLRRVGKRVEASALAAAERDLVFSARYMRLERLAGLITRTEERLDAEHRDALAQERRERRFLRIGEAADGMVTINGRLDPENGAPLVAAMQAMVNQNFRLRKRMQDAAKAGESVIVDERTPEQVRADAMGDFARHLLGCEVTVLPRAGVTLVVRTSLEQLRQGLGGASVDGHAASIDAGALRRAAAAAGVVPQVLGSKSEVLDQGVKVRLFSSEQKLALVERDGGCAMCGAPPSWCDAHHLVHWAHGGRTDLANGVMLCVRCHHDVHRAGWKIEATASEVWFIPPAEVDPARRRRPGGRRLFDVYPLEPEVPRGADAAEVDAVDEPRERGGGACPLVRREPCVSMRVEARDDSVKTPADEAVEELVGYLAHGVVEESHAVRAASGGARQMSGRTPSRSRAPARRHAETLGPPGRRARLHSQATRRS
ncbi:DUF222 domain-containing protein [Demequina sp. NBRC 110057]|uniref:HNH endonuclease signature motif containing protein n=1 Tax=Demequina sp. NBRC 110057 TaxID=1570346 RepID=UPI0013566EF7|nr:DUF222 domain-containing protein [Demequina sp. NBRC 110057]